MFNIKKIEKFPMKEEKLISDYPELAALLRINEQGKESTKSPSVEARLFALESAIADVALTQMEENN